jgi:hypothetical protein
VRKVLTGFALRWVGATTTLSQDRPLKALW